ncbi:MAG: T9SS type A sorting domain-containing protein [Bacteroidetes bacterium]|nr:T9SS type A sorting domain-containing protein [Bacteroidota bacterium]
MKKELLTRIHPFAIRSIFLMVFLCLSFSSKATTIVSRATGNWTTDATWIYYCTGTASFTNGSTTVTGSGTFFSTEVSIGSVLLLQSSSGTVRGTVLSITNNTTLILSSAATATASGSYGKEKAPTDGSGEDISITGGFTVTTDFSSDFDINSLSISGSNTLTHSANKKIIIARGLTLDGTLGGASSKEVQVNGSNSSGILLSGTGTYSASGNLALQGDVTVPATTTLSFSGSGKLDMNGKTLTNDGRINILDPSSFVASGTFINNGATSYLKYTKQADFPNITLTATATGNTVEFGWSTGSYQIENTASYYNIVLSGGGTKETDNNNIKIYGDLTIGNGNIFSSSTGNDNITIYGNWDNDNGGSFSGSSTKTTTFAGTANNQTIYTPTGGETFGKLTINNTYGTVTAAGNIYIASGSTLTMTAGTFNMGTYILDDASGTADYTQTGGDLQLAKLSTVLPQLSGTYTISGGTITLNGAGVQSIRGETVSSPIVANYYNLVLGGSGVKTMEGDLDVNGDLTIGGAAILDVSNTNNSSNIKNIALAGNWNNTSSVSDPFYERTGTVTFDAANDVTLTASPVSGGETFYNLTINKTASTDDLTLNNHATVTNSLTLATGHIITAATSKYLIMGASSSLGATPTDNSHVSGPMQKICTSTSAFVFPVGKSGSYRWLEITPTTTSSTTFTSEYFYASPASNTSYGTGVNHVSDVEYWNLSRSGSANAAVKLSWNTNSAVTTNTTDLLVVQWDVTSSWVNRCGGGCSVTGGSTTSAGSISAGSISTFGNAFTLASPNANNELGNSRYSVANGNWSSTAVWATRSGGSPGASAPTSTKKVIIEGGFRVDVDAASACQKLTIGNTGTGTLDFNATGNDLDVGSDGIIINSNGDAEGTSATAELRTIGSITLNSDISAESGGGSSSFVLRRLTTGSGTIDGTGTCDNLDIDASTTNNGNITINSIFQGSNTLTNVGTLVFKGTNANFAGGTLDATTVGNTVQFNNTTASFDINEKTTYYNLTVSGNSTKVMGSDLTINGNLTINNSATLNLDADDKELIIKGNFVNSGTFTASTNTGREVTFSGSAEQQITSGGSCFFRLYIANTSSTGVVLQDAACIATSGKIDLSDGYLYLGSYNLSLNGTATSPTSASSASFIVTNGTGSMSAVCSNITFPVGSSGSTTSYTPLTINNSGTSDTYSVRICDNASSDGTCGGTAISSGVVNKMWQISEGVAGGSNVSLTLQWSSSNEGGSFTRTAAMIAHYTGGQWNATQSATAASGSGPYTLNVTGLTSFSPYSVISSAAPLPVELLSFTAKLDEEGKVDIRWATASEINNDLFAIERSKDGKYFEVIEQVPGAGNSNHVIMYFAEDKIPFDGISYYRLKQVDFDGTTSYSSIVGINSRNSKNVAPALSFSLYPNPTASTAYLSFSNVVEGGQVSIRVYDLSGKEVYSALSTINTDGDVAPIDASAFPSGIYIVNAVCNGVVMHQKLLVTKEH